MHELEKVRKQLEVEKLELQSALEEAEVRACFHLHPCLLPPTLLFLTLNSSSPKTQLLASYS